MKAGLAAESLLGAALAGRAARSEAPSRREVDAGFAGLLGGALQQQGGSSGREKVYDGSAFDVPEARPPEAASRGGSQADIERRQIDQRQQRVRNEAKRETAPAEPSADDAPKAAESRSPSVTNKPRAPDAPRESGRAPRECKAVAEPEASESPAAAATSEARDARAAPTEGEPLAATASTTQEWMARWAALSGADAVGGSAGTVDGQGTPSTAALQRLATATAAASAGDAGAAQASGRPTAAPEDQAAPASADVALVAPAAALSEHRADASAAAALATAIDAPGALPPGHAAGPSTASAMTAPAPATSSVPVPLNAPDFSQALGWQLATLARDGVHEAQLQLNPVEMGPVQVQILLDGGQAQIDFTAAHARTREVLEAGWPALAAAMHSAGFTLGGGGVFEQRTPERDAQRGGEGSRSRGGEAGDGPALVGVARPPGANPRGLLDLYA